MDILVTGGAGFIGGHLTERFVGDGHDIIVLDNFEPYYDRGLKQKNVEVAKQVAASSSGSYELVEGSTTNQSLVTELVARVDIVFHHAAQAGVRTSVDHPRKVNAYNVQGTLNVLDAARDSQIQRVVNASSSSVYGVPEYLPYDEDHPTTPISPYGASKLAAEHYVRVYNEVYGLPTVSLRYFTVYGPRMRPNMAITNFVSRSLHGESPVIYGDGSQTRDFTHIDDVVEANHQLLNEDGGDGEVMNIGSTDNIDILALGQEVRDAIDESLTLEFTGRQPGDAEHTHANVEKAADLIGYEPSVDIRDGVTQFISWYRQNMDWYDSLVRSS